MFYLQEEARKEHRVVSAPTATVPVSGNEGGQERLPDVLLHAAHARRRAAKSSRRGGYVYVVNEVEIPVEVYAAAAPHRLHHAEASASLDSLSNDSRGSPPFQGWMAAADGYLIRWSALCLSTVHNLPPLPIDTMKHGANASYGLTGATASHVREMRDLVRASASGQDSSLSSVHSNVGAGAGVAGGDANSQKQQQQLQQPPPRLRVDPYMLVPTVFGPCLPYAIAPLLHGMLWQDVLVAGPVLKYSARKDCWYRAFAALFVPGGRAAVKGRVRAADAAVAANTGPEAWSAEVVQQHLQARTSFPSDRAVLLLFKGREAPTPHPPPKGLPPAPTSGSDPPLWASYAASHALTLTVSVRGVWGWCQEADGLSGYPPSFPFSCAGGERFCRWLGESNATRLYPKRWC
jgi:hypothetical protein